MLRLRFAVLLALLIVAPSAASMAAELPNPFYPMDTSFQRPGLTPQEQLDLVKELGCAGVAWHEQPAEQVKATVADLEKRGLTMFTIYCLGTFAPQSDLTWSAHLPGILETLRGHGRIIWIHFKGKGPTIDKLTGGAPVIAALRDLAEKAKANGLQVAIYPHYGEWTAHFADATRVARLVDRPNFGVTFNLCHCLAAGDGDRIDSLLQEAGPLLFTVTICGADAGVNGPKWNNLILRLDQGTFDVGGVLRKLKQIGFTGPIGFQGYHIPGDARSILTPTVRAWHKLSAAAGG